MTRLAAHLTDRFDTVEDQRSVAEAILRELACGQPRCRCLVSERRGHGRTHCPVHQDANPSFGVDLRDGTLLCFCYGGCPQNVVVEALKSRNLWPERARYGKEILATYDYCDSTGKLLYQTVRFVPKDFAQRKPAGGPDKWEWALGDIPRVLYRLPELIAADTNRIRLIVEGEKDVDRLSAEGMLATCNVGGAGKWRPEYSEQFRGSNVVIVVDNDDAGRNHSMTIARSLNGVARTLKWLELPDVGEHGDVSDWLNDGGTVADLQALVRAAPDPPIDRARETSFRREGNGYRFEPAEAPVVMSFSRLADHRDETTAEVAVKRVSDGQSLVRRRLNLVGASGVPSSLIKMLDQAQLGVDADIWPSILNMGFEKVLDAHRDGLVLETIQGDIRRPPPPEWLCPGLVMLNKMNCWLGAAGTGKSTLAKILCVCVATGHGFLGRLVKRGMPLYLDWEDDREDFERVIHDTCRWLGVWPVPKFGWIRMKGKRLRDSVDSLSRHIDGLGATFMVIDSIAAAGGAAGEHRGYEDIALELEQCVGQLPPITLLGLDHITSDEHKNGTLVIPQKARGSERKVEIYRNQWTLMADQEQRQMRRHVVSWYHTKVNADVFYPQFTVEIFHEPDNLRVEEVSAATSTETVKRFTFQRQNEVFVQENPGCTTDEVAIAVRGDNTRNRRDVTQRELGRSKDRGVLNRDESGRWWPAGHPDMPRQLSGSLLSGLSGDLSGPESEPDDLSGQDDGVSGPDNVVHLPARDSFEGRPGSDLPW